MGQDNDPHHETVYTIQEAINKAVSLGRVVRFKSHLTNKDIKKGIVDIKGCKILKPHRFSDDIAVLPPGIKTYDFDDVPTSIITLG